MKIRSSVVIRIGILGAALAVGACHSNGTGTDIVNDSGVGGASNGGTVGNPGSGGTIGSPGSGGTGSPGSGNTVGSPGSGGTIGGGSASGSSSGGGIDSNPPPSTYHMTATAGANGAITPASAIVQAGATATFTVTPDSGYAIESVSGCGGSLSGNTYTAGPVSADCAITASFKLLASGDAFYISPNGSDANICSSSARCATVTGVIKKAAFGPGDVIIFGDGTYVNPAINIDCSKDTQKLDGIQAKPITLRAEHERQAHLTSTNGGFVIQLNNCPYWTVEGLRFSQADFATKTSTDVGNFYNSPHIVFRDNLMSRDNLLNTGSGGGFLFDNTPDFLVEDNEFYDFRRHAALTKYQQIGGVFRGNYCNPRGHGGFATPNGDGTCFTIYPGSNIIVEDNVTEGNTAGGFDSAPFDHDNINNQWLGNIGINQSGMLILQHSRCDGSQPSSTKGSVVRDNLIVGGDGRLLESRSSQVVASHNSAFGGKYQGFVADQETCSLEPNIFKVSDSLAFDEGTGFYVSSNVTNGTFVFMNDAVFGNDRNFYSASTSSIKGTITQDPRMGTARVCVPKNSPLHGAASDGGDIGANVLYQYGETGVKTTQPRWVTTKPASCPANASGIYPYGMQACIKGVNDDASTSLAGIADRLGMTKTQVEVTCGATGYFK